MVCVQEAHISFVRGGLRGTLWIAAVDLGKSFPEKCNISELWRKFKVFCDQTKVLGALRTWDCQGAYPVGGDDGSVGFHSFVRGYPAVSS